MRKTILLLTFLSISFGVISQSPNTKRGLSFGYGETQVADIEAMSGKLSWYYNWGTQAESNVEGILIENNVEFVPMTWNAGFNEENLRSFYANHPESKYLLGFNEPNFKEQANMTPSQAADQWPRLEALAEEFGLEIVGPAVNWCGNCVSEDGTTYNNPYTYLDDFFAACPDCQVDYIAVHSYMCYSPAMLGYLNAFKDYGKKLWLTEFACWEDGENNLTQQKSLMFDMLDKMDNDTMIHRYSWFIGRAGSWAPPIGIFKNAGEATELGEIYLNFNSAHDTTVFIDVPARIEAESYSDGFGVQLEGTSDFDGVANVGYIDGGDWLEYNINVSDAGDYFLYLRISANENTSTDIYTDELIAGTISIPSTGGWQNWETIKFSVYLEPGESKLRLLTSTGGFNTNWLNISKRDNTAPTVDVGKDTTLILPKSSITLIGTAEDVDADELQYKWKKASGGDYDMDSPNEASTLVRGLKKGNYIFRCTVSDGLDVAYDNVLVKVIEETGVSEKLTDAGVLVYPNPVENILNVVLPEPGASYAVELMNAVGQIIHSENCTDNTQNEFVIDFVNMKSGIYFLKLRSANKVFIQRVLK
jgi:hypothetical protein